MVEVARPPQRKPLFHYLQCNCQCSVHLQSQRCEFKLHAELTWILATCRDNSSICKRSPITVLTRPEVHQLHWLTAVLPQSQATDYEKSKMYFAVCARKQRQKGTHSYQTSPTLSTPIIPFLADRLHRRGPQIFRISICTCLAYWMIPSAAWRYWRLNDPFCSERGSNTAAMATLTTANVFEWPGQPPKNVISHWGICTPSNA